MKHFIIYLSLLILSCTGKAEQPVTPVTPAPVTTTIVLLRHAEKELTGTNPSLSPAGFERASKLQGFLSDIKPDAFYSSDYLRTKQTLEPWANNLGKTIIIYDPTQQDSVAKMLKQQTGKTLVVSGHSNTIPYLVNNLIGKNEYTDLPDNEFGRIFVVTIKNDTALVEIRNY